MNKPASLGEYLSNLATNNDTLQVPALFRPLFIDAADLRMLTAGICFRDQGVDVAERADLPNVLKYHTKIMEEDQALLDHYEAALSAMRFRITAWIRVYSSDDKGNFLRPSTSIPDDHSLLIARTPDFSERNPNKVCYGPDQITPETISNEDYDAFITWVNSLRTAINQELYSVHYRKQARDEARQFLEVEPDNQAAAREASSRE